MVKKAKVKKSRAKLRTKRGRYKRGISTVTGEDFANAGEKLGSSLHIRLPDDFILSDGPKYTPAPILTLCGQLEDAILLLETRISNSIAKINSLM